MNIPQSICKEAENIQSVEDECQHIRSKRCWENSHCNSVKKWLHRSTPYVLHQLTTTAWQSYSFLFFRFVVGMNASGFGWLYLVSQLTKSITITLYKCCNQRSTDSAEERFSGSCGRGLKNAVHLLGSIGILFFWPFLFAPCLACSVKLSEVLMILSYGFPVLMFSFCWASLELAKNSPEKSEGHSAELSQAEHFERLFQSYTHKSLLGLLLHLITWIFLANSKGKHISADTQSAFAYQTLFILITGFFTTVSYYVTSYKTSGRCHKEKKDKDLQLREDAKVHHSTTAQTPLKITQDDSNVRHDVWPWKLHIQDLNYMRSVFVYILSSNAFSVTMLILPVYLIESIRSNKLAVAYFPAVVSGGWSLAVVLLERLLMTFGCKILFCASSIMMFCASVWFFAQSIRLSYLLYFPALTFGFSACVMMVTSQAMLFMSSKHQGLYLIGADDFTKTLNEILNGFVVLFIMQMFPQEHQSRPSQLSGEFLRFVMFLVPAIHATVTFIEVFFYTNAPKEKSPQTQNTKTLQQRLALEDSSKDVVIQQADLETLEDLPSTNV